MKVAAFNSQVGVHSQGLRAYFFSIILFLTPAVGFSGSTTYDMQSNNYYFEFLSFKADEDNTFLEIFCQIPIENLRFANVHKGLLAKYHISVTMFDLDGIQIDGLELIDSVKVNYDDEVAHVPPYHLIRFAFYMKPGDYVATIRLTDQQAHSFVSFDNNLTISDYNEDELQLSDIQIASNITKSDDESVLVKNNKKVVPNVSHIFGTEHKRLYVYSEVYGLNYSDKNAFNEFLARYTIIDRNGTEVKKVNYKFSKPGDTGAFGVGIPVTEIGSGEYKLVLEIEDLDNSQSTKKRANFRIIKPLFSFSNEDFFKIVRQLRYVASSSEIEQLNSLPESQRSHGLQQFWQKKDPMPETEQNEFMSEYLRRLNYANRHFSNITAEGWETDRGEIYIKNGPPDKIDRLTASEGSKLYEVWEYDSVNRRYIFVDNWGLGSFQLLKTRDSIAQEFTLH